MEDLGTEISKLCSFGITQFINTGCLFDNAWIIVVDTIDICPDLDLISMQGCTNDRCGVITSSSAQIVNLTSFVSADITLRDVNPFFTCSFNNGFQQFLN